MQGLTLPHLSQADPETQGEGSLNPLGLSALADGLADEIAPSVTARMTRLRFLTALAVGACVTEELEDLPCADGVTPPYVVFEWLVVEAFGRRGGELPPAATLQLPGIDKTRRLLATGWDKHLDAMAYLKTPRVFGFSGVFRRLAVGLEIVDRNDHLLPRGEELVRIWEQEQQADGFLGGSANSPGQRFRRAIEGQVREALGAGRLVTAPGSHLWGKLVQRLRLDGAGPAEREYLWRLLTDSEAAMRRELLILLDDVPPDTSERAALEQLAPRASKELARRLQAIAAFERFAGLLFAGFDLLRYASTAAGTAPVQPRAVTSHDLMGLVANELPSAARDAEEQLERYGRQGIEFADAFSGFQRPMEPEELVEALLQRHETVQLAKGGKRPWLERLDRGFFVRPGQSYEMHEPPDPDPPEYIHPYRIAALRSFRKDLGR